jgi:hypothetical protein
MTAPTPVLSIRLPEARVPTFSAFLAEFRQDVGGWSETTGRGLSGVLKNLQAELRGHPSGPELPRLTMTTGIAWPAVTVCRACWGEVVAYLLPSPGQADAWYHPTTAS